MSKLERYRLSKPKMLYLLDKFRENSREIASLCVPPGYSIKTIEGLLETITDRAQVPSEAAQAIHESPTGGMLFWGENHRYLVMPPFPLKEERNAAACEIEPLARLLNQEFLLALILVRLGSYAVGVYQGQERVTSKVGTGNVHARHRQGGSSSHRFERHREKQMETFFTRVCVHAREQLEPYAKQLEWVIYGGTRETLLDFRKQCHFSQQFDSRTLDLLLNVREPGQAGLEEAIREAWSCRILRWVETESQPR
jgi:peptide subunit release factor 1 (eRF1)